MLQLICNQVQCITIAVSNILTVENTIPTVTITLMEMITAMVLRMAIRTAVNSIRTVESIITVMNMGTIPILTLILILLMTTVKKILTHMEVTTIIMIMDMITSNIFHFSQFSYTTDVS